MFEDVQRRKHLRCKLLRLLYQETVGENNRRKQVPIAELGQALALYEPPETGQVLNEDEKDRLYEQGKVMREIVLALHSAGLLEVFGKANPYYDGQVSISQGGIEEVERTILQDEYSDKELRNILLQEYYAMRQDEFVSVNEATFGTEIELPEVYRICKQLDQLGLIDFKPLHGDDRIVSAVARITAHGVDVVEQARQHAPSQFTLISQTIELYDKKAEHKKKAEDEMLQILRDLRDRTDSEESLLLKANKVVQLKPNMFGIGLDLNELVRRLITEN